MKKVDIKLHGILGKELGRRFFSLAVSSVSEALHAINVLTSNKLNRVLNNHGYDKFNVVINGRTVKHDKVLDPKDPNVYKEISNSELVLKTNKLESIDIIPVIEASDSDIFAIILGVLLIVVGAFTGVGPVIGTALIMGGIGIAAAGIINLLSKPPSFEPFQEIGGVTKKSYLFNGPENTVGEGGVVPVGYGRLIVGSQTVSASYDIYNVPVDNGVNNSPNKENIISAWYFRTSEHINFNDPIKKISYFAVSKLSGRGNLQIVGTKDTQLSSFRYNATNARPTNTLRLPQECLVNFLQNNPGNQNTDPSLNITINGLNGYELTPEKNTAVLDNPSLVKTYDIKLYFYGQSIGDFYLDSISNGDYESLKKDEGATSATISSSSIFYPYPVSLNNTYLTSLTIQGFIPSNESFNIVLKNNSAQCPLVAIVVGKPGAFDEE